MPTEADTDRPVKVPVPGPFTLAGCLQGGEVYRDRVGAGVAVRKPNGPRREALPKLLERAAEHEIDVGATVQIRVEASELERARAHVTSYYGFAMPAR